MYIYYNIVTIWFLFIIQLINLPPNAHTITFSAHCSSLQPSAAYSQTSSAHTTAGIASSVHILQQPLHLQCTLQSCTAICSQSSVHTAANCSHLQPPTLQLYHSVHTAATLSDANTIQCIY